MSRVKTAVSRLALVAIVGVSFVAQSCARAPVAHAVPESETAPFDPPAVYLTWQRDPTTAMTIQWHSQGARDDVVEYQRLDERAWHTVTGSHHPMPYSDRIVHVAELTGLTPGTDYRFRFGGHSAEFRFRSMPGDAREGIRFVVGGDTMDGFDLFDEWYEETLRVVAQQDPMFAVIGGDIAYANGASKEVKRWYRWLSGWKKHMVTSDGRLIPVLATIGNHEVRGQYGQTPEEAPYFYNVFALPGKRSYRVLDFDRYLSLVLLDSGHTQAIDGEQADWLRQTLADRQDVPNLFAVYHVPGYPSVRNFDNDVSATIREHWVPLFERFGVDVAFEHHDHAYKRTHPIRAGKVDPRGVLYLGDGGWGVMPRRPRDRWYLAKTAAKRHFILVTIDGKTRSFLAIDSTGQVFDQVSQSVSFVSKPQ